MSSLNNQHRKKNKWVYKNVSYASQGEMETAILLSDKKSIELEYQPEKLTIVKPYTANSGKKHQAMKYEPDFLVKHNTLKIFLEIKGDNDMIFTFTKNGRSIQNNAPIYRLKHKIIDDHFRIERPEDIFAVVRFSKLKTPEYAGLFWEKDFEQLKKFKTQKRKDLCEKVPRINQRIAMWIKEYYTKQEEQND